MESPGNIRCHATWIKGGTLEGLCLRLMQILAWSGLVWLGLTQKIQTCFTQKEGADRGVGLSKKPRIASRTLKSVSEVLPAVPQCLGRLASWLNLRRAALEWMHPNGMELLGDVIVEILWPGFLMCNDDYLAKA